MGKDSTQEPSFELRLVIEGENDNPLSIQLPEEFSRQTLGDLLNTVFPEESDAQSEIKGFLDARANPDLPEIYNAFLNVFLLWRRNYNMLHFFAEDGLELGLYQSIGSIFEESPGFPRLAITIQQTFDVFATYQEKGGSREELTEWLRGNTLLYFLDRHSAKIYSQDFSGSSEALSQAVADLRAREFAGFEETSNTLEISPNGRRLLGEMITETESYIDMFDIFKDVAINADDSVAFDSGYGADLRVQVYEAEGLDPIRTVFLLRMYDGTLDEFSDDWRHRIGDNEFFNEVLRPVLDHQRVDDSLIEWVIEGGFAHNEAEAEKARESAAQDRLVRRVRWK